MARPPKKDKPPKAEAPAVDGKLNTLSDAQRQALFNNDSAKYERLLKTQKAAAKAVRDFGKIIKADLGEFGLDMIKLAIKIRDGGEDEETAAKDFVLEQLRVMRWSGLPVGFQETLFDEGDTRTPLERAYESGKTTGMRGEAMVAPEQYNQGDVFQEWCRGWHDGQSQIFDIRPTAEPAGDDGGNSD